jgi:hypothetical protein
VGLELSREYEVENGTPQGTDISPIFFTMMSDDIFGDIGQDIGVALYADDGAIWKGIFLMQ